LTSSKKTTKSSPAPASSLAAPDPWIRLACIRRTQGRKGEVFAEILTDFPEKFASRRRLWLLPPGAPAREVELIHHWLHKGGIVLHFAGVDSISAAENLKGSYIAIPLAERTPLAENEAYISDLAGCTLVDVAGPEPVIVGTIEDVDRTAGAAPLLVLRGAHGEVLIPFAGAYLRKIDLAAKRVEMALPEGLADLNAS
jgi:16S rRNA processing protein RimM